MSHVHITKDGQEIPLNKLTNAHLSYIIAHNKKRAKEGVDIIYGSVGFWDEPFADVETVYGNEALDALNHKEYENELKRRFA